MQNPNNNQHIVDVNIILVFPREYMANYISNYITTSLIIINSKNVNIDCRRTNIVH